MSEKAGVIDMVHLTRRIDLSSGHRLWVEGLSAEENRRIFGECSRLHGHNYTLEVTFAGEPDPKTGMVVHFSELDKIIRDRVVSRLDHRNIDEDVAELKGTPSTVEVLVRYIWGLLEGQVPGARLHRVRLWEDRDSCADYYGEGV
jgi:6-pyruvoyltetrahydropterin/6-carboxytetrahydropterin synthase